MVIGPFYNFILEEIIFKDSSPTRPNIFLSNTNLILDLRR